MFLKRFVLLPTPKQPSTDNNICLSKHSDYYTEIQTNFLQTFQQKWKEENISESHSIKPLLMAWGYYANTTDFKHKYIVDHAVSIKRIYQASKLLDTNPEAVSLINKTLPTLKGENYKLDLIAIHELGNITNQILNGKVKFDFDLIELLNSTLEKLLSNCFFIGYHLSNPEDKDSDTELATQKIGMYLKNIKNVYLYIPSS